MGCVALLLLSFWYVLGPLLKPIAEALRFDWNDYIFAIFRIHEPALVIFSLLVVGKNARRKLAVRGISWLHLLLVIAIVAPAFIVYSLVSRTSSAILPETPFAYRLALQPDELTLEGRSWWVMLLLGAVFPAVGEEICFRGLLGRLALARFGVFWGVLLTAAFFSTMHLKFSRFATLTLMGVVMHILFLSTKTILAPVLYHFLINGASYTLSKLQSEAKFLSGGGEGVTPISPMLGVAAVVALVSLLILFCRTRVTWAADGEIWTPGYPSAEMPPPEVHARASYRFCPRAWAATVIVYLGFVGIFALNVPVWLDCDQYWHLMAQAHAKNSAGDYRGAIADCDEAIRIVPSFPNAYLERGWAQENLKNYELAIDDYTASIEITPHRAWPYYSRGGCYNHLGQHADALADANKAVELAPSDWGGYMTRAFANYHLGKHASALSDFNETIRLNPSNAFAYQNRAAIREAMGNHAAAREDLQTAKSLEPK
jgi:membrane protease YdiL (CAAX protease family)/Tfp pilus assembly protein PilF